MDPPSSSPLQTLFVTDPSSEAHRAAGHPEGPERLTTIIEQLERIGLRQRMLELPAREATTEELLAVHTPELLERIEVAARVDGHLDADTYVTSASPAVARRAAGAAIEATAAVTDGQARNGFVAVRPPGHHATSDRAMGFCLYNGIAVAAAAALRGGVERLAILDWDVHHGNGTQAIFDADPRVFYGSTHEYPFYPGTGHYLEVGSGAGRGTMVNVPLPAGAGDRCMEAAYREVVLPAMERFEPELVLVSCGWDAHARDPLAMLEVSTAGYTTVARLALEAAGRSCEGRLVAILEGGYDRHALAWCASGLCQLLLGEEPEPDPDPSVWAAEPDITPILEATREAIRLE